jgi:hypothetical protein
MTIPRIFSPVDPEYPKQIRDITKPIRPKRSQRAKAVTARTDFTVQRLSASGCAVGAVARAPPVVFVGSDAAGDPGGREAADLGSEGTAPGVAAILLVLV